MTTHVSRCRPFKTWKFCSILLYTRGTSLPIGSWLYNILLLLLHISLWYLQWWMMAGHEWDVFINNEDILAACCTVFYLSRLYPSPFPAMLRTLSLTPHTLTPGTCWLVKWECFICSILLNHNFATCFWPFHSDPPRLTHPKGSTLGQSDPGCRGA